jgi:hypothetical protein
MPLGFAVQLGRVCFLCTFLEEPHRLRAGVAADLARHLNISDVSCLAR